MISQSPAPSPTPDMVKNEADLVHFGDLIDVDFAGGVENDWRGSLTTDGMLEGLDQYSRIPALCRSETDIAADIARAYSKILRDPQVTVKIADRTNRAVARLQGAVKVPTRFRIQRAVRLRELIVAAGGFTDDASGEIVIFRPENLSCGDHGLPVPADQKGPQGNGLPTINITISELLSGKKSADPVILSGDLVTVEKAVPTYVIGAVNDPKPIFSRTGMTLSRAIATAGGLAKGAIGQKVTIYRRIGTESSVIQADLEKIQGGEAADIELKAFDVIDVPLKGRAPRKYPPVIARSDSTVNISDLPLRVLN